MSVFTVTGTNWNDPSFWASINLTGIGNTLDFSSLSKSYEVQFNGESGVITITDGATSFTIGDVNAGGGPYDATLGGSTELEYFDNVVGGGGYSFIDGHMGADTIYGSAGSDNIFGGWQDDGNDVVYAGDGDDYVGGGGGGDEIHGGKGWDWLEGDEGDDTIYGDAGTDLLIGGAGNDMLDGGKGDDEIHGGVGADTLLGGDGADELWGNYGDSVDGGEGGTDDDTLFVYDVDHISYSTAESGTVYFNDASTLSFTNVETVTILSSDGIVSGTSGDDDIDLFYHDGDGDWVDGWDAVGAYGVTGDGDYILAGDGDDWIQAGNGDDIVYGEAGNDGFESWDGNDLLYGGTGDDYFVIGWMQQTAFGEDDADTFEVYATQVVDGGAGGNDDDLLILTDVDHIQLTAVDSNGNGWDGVAYLNSGDTVTFSEIETFEVDGAGWGPIGVFDGTDVSESIRIGDSDGDGDQVDGTDGDDDIILADGGDDTIEYGDGDNLVYGGAGNDIIDDVNGSQLTGSDTIHGGAGDDTIRTGGGDDTVYGEADNDTISGEDGNDYLDGGTGNDIIVGNDGADTIVGGTGFDTLYAGDEDNPAAPPSAVGYWTFDQYSTPEDDLAAPDNDMSFIGGADVPSGSGKLDLDGSGDYGVIADNPAYDLDAATVTMSFTLDSLSALTGLFGKDAYGNATGDFSVWVETNGNVVVRWQDDTTDHYLRSGAGAVTTGTEHNVHVTIDNASGTIELYVDGTLEDSASAPGATLDGNVNPWVVGARGWGSTRGTADTIINELDGTINAFAIFDGAYTPAEIADPAGGADVIDGGAGDDQIHGDAGDDLISGGDGSDTIFLYDHFGSDTITGGEGGVDDDRIDAGDVSIPLTVIFTGAESGTISDGTSTIAFSEIEMVETGSDADVIDATALATGVRVASGFGDDSVYGGAGADTFWTGHGDDYVTGGAGNDSVATDHGDDTVIGGDGADTVWAGFGNDIVTGDAGDDFLYGGYGVDTIHGGAGDDTIGVGRTDGDIAYGDDGSDQFLFDDDMGDATIYGGEGGSDVDLIEFGSLYGDGISVVWTVDEDGTATEPDGTITFHEIEGAIGSDHADTIDASATTTGKILDGGAGADTIIGGSGADLLTGNVGDDTFVFADGFGNDTIVGGETGETTGDTLDFSGVTVPLTVVFSGTDAGTVTDGTDTLAFTGIERLVLGSGADSVSAGADADGIDVVAGAGADTLQGGTGNDTFDGGEGGDFIYTEGGDDLVYGGDDVDVIFSGQDDDTLYGDGGGDIFIVNGSEVSTTDVFGGETGENFGDVLILSGDGSGTPGVQVTFSGDEAGQFDDGTNSGRFAEIEQIQTSSGDDTIDASAATAGADIVANSGADSVVGGAGADTINAGSGDDTVAGGAGDDTITGGGGDDTFTFSDGDGADVITDFDLADDDLDGATNDQLDLSALTDSGGNPVNIWDVVVSDTAGDGSGDAILTFPDGESLTLAGVDPAVLDAAMMQAMGIPCLVAGTLIDTPDGGRLVERLRPGDLVTTPDGGTAPVVWAASRRIGARALALRPGLRPVRIRRGALGNWRDLLVSPQHRIALGPVGAPTAFAPARWLARDGDGRFRVARGRKTVTYVHVMLASHALIRAEGAWVESFYPGPQGLAALDPGARAKLFARVPELAAIRSKADAQRIYGPLALAPARRRDLARYLDTPTPRRALRVAARPAAPKSGAVQHLPCL